MQRVFDGKRKYLPAWRGRADVNEKESEGLCRFWYVLLRVPLDTGEGTGYNTSVKSDAEEEYSGFLTCRERAVWCKPLAESEEGGFQAPPRNVSVWGGGIPPLPENECGLAPKFRWYHGHFVRPEPFAAWGVFCLEDTLCRR